MKLSQLVKARDMMLKVSTDKATDLLNEFVAQFNDIRSTVEIPFEVERKLIELASHIDKVKDDLNKIAVETSSYSISVIEREISELTKDYFARGYKINDSYATNRSNVEFERSDRKLPITPETEEKVISRIRKYSNWHYPGLEIGPGDGYWTHHLVANDPLYIVDIEHEFLESTVSQFSVEYQRRIRPYYIDWTKSETDLSMLPQNQFGFVFSWNVFNYFPLDMIKQYLLQVWEILRPGGVFMFSYNDGENPESIKVVESGFMSYMPKSMLKSLCEGLGFEIIDFYDYERLISWVEIKKPGELSTIKAHQTMGLIKGITS